MTTTTEPAEVRVARGAALLDQRRPGWHDIVNAARIQVSSGSSCVLGQIYPERDSDNPVFGDKQPGFYRGAEDLFGKAAWTLEGNAKLVSHGFLESSYYEDSAVINRAWRAEVARRRQAAGT